MKKVLFATTALVASAGMAAADGHTGVALTGSAQMGVANTGTTALALADDGDALTDISRTTTEGTTQFVQDIDVTFTLSGETDGGITFGAAIDLDESASGVDTDDGGVAIFVSGDFGTLTMGDTDGGFDAGMVEVPAGPGSINDDHTSHLGWNGNAGLDGSHDGQILSYAYSVSGFTITGSVELDDSGTFDPIYGIGAQYTGSFGGGSFTVGAGYQTASNGYAGPTLTAAADLANEFADTIVFTWTEGTIYGISGSVSLDSGLSAGITYSMFEGTATAVSNLNVPAAFGDAAATVTALGTLNIETTHIGVGVAYDFGDISVGANYGQVESDFPFASGSGYGLSAAYDLGGGLSANAGYGVSNYDAAGVDNVTRWSVGVMMSF